jgi:hypothetical protein
MAAPVHAGSTSASTAWDGYERLAEFHDLFMTEPWERLRPRVRSALAHLGDTAVVVEIGAGSGIGTRTIPAETRARIVAVEPALVMRSILTARVADHPHLADRVTVVAGSAPADLGEVPATIDAFVCAHMLGHLDRETRADSSPGSARPCDPTVSVSSPPRPMLIPHLVATTTRSWGRRGQSATTSTVPTIFHPTGRANTPAASSRPGTTGVPSPRAQLNPLSWTISHAWPYTYFRLRLPSGFVYRPASPPRHRQRSPDGTGRSSHRH